MISKLFYTMFLSLNIASKLTEKKFTLSFSPLFLFCFFHIINRKIFSNIT